MEPKYIKSAINKFAQAQIALTMAARSLQMSGFPCDGTLKEIKENIGDLAIAIEILKEQLG